MDTTRYLPFIGRLLIGLPFAMSGLGKLAAYGPTTAMIAAVGLPVPPLAYARGRRPSSSAADFCWSLAIRRASSQLRWQCSRLRRRCRSTATSPTRIR